MKKEKYILSDQNESKISKRLENSSDYGYFLQLYLEGILAEISGYNDEESS